MATTEQVIAKYVELRDRRDAGKREWETKEREFNTALGRLEEWLKEKFVVDGIRTTNTAAGTAFFTTKDRTTITDFEAMLAYCKQEDRWDLLERRVSKNAVKSVMDQNRDGTFNNPPPPGVDYVRWEEIQVQRPRS